MKNNTVRRIKPDFPKWKTPQSGAGFIFGALLWIVMILVFVVMAYAAWFSINLVYFMKMIKDKNYQIPIWFSVICVLCPITFPITFFVILGGTLTKIIREAR